MITIKNLSLFIFLILFLFACSTSTFYEKNINIPKDKWERNNIVNFEVKITDTVAIHNIYINIRNTGEYPMSNLFIFVKTTAPYGFSVKDTFECLLADKDGRWLGRGFGDAWSHQILFLKNVRFPYVGKYIFELEQAMRNEKLPGILDVGLKIEKVKIK